MQFERNEDVLSALSAICAEDKEIVWKSLIESDRTDYRTATYLLLLDRKLRGLPVKISSNSRSHLVKVVRLSTCFFFFWLAHLFQIHAIIFFVQPIITTEGSQEINKEAVNAFLTTLDKSPSSKHNLSPTSSNTYKVLPKTPEAGKAYLIFRLNLIIIFYKQCLFNTILNEFVSFFFRWKQEKLYSAE